MKPVLIEVHCSFPYAELGCVSEYGNINAVSVSRWEAGGFVYDTLQVDAYARQMSLVSGR